MSHCLEKTVESFQTKYSKILANIINEEELTVTAEDLINAGKCLLKNKVTSLSNFESPVRKSIFVLVKISEIQNALPRIGNYIFPIADNIGLIVALRLGVSPSKGYYLINTFLKRELVAGGTLLPSSQQIITELIELNAVADQFFVNSNPECISSKSSTLINFYPKEFVGVFYNTVNPNYRRAHKNYIDEYGKKFTIALQYF